MGPPPPACPPPAAWGCFHVTVQASPPEGASRAACGHRASGTRAFSWRLSFSSPCQRGNHSNLQRIFGEFLSPAEGGCQGSNISTD